MSKKTQMKITRKTNPRIPALISVLKDTARENDAPIWKDMAKRLEKPSRIYAEVNLSKINRHAAENDLVLVPGKVLGAGALGHAVTVAALTFSTTAVDKITSAGGKCMTIEQILEENPAGSGIRIMQ
ncbi:MULTISPECIES: 50S ribosomal protein L18e [Methanococcoides]|jgi:large subunit ribosomal protein L18e|uniref:Large ribosomal subunit protein eL18 n=1 Tax=Methanococcoides seepicolus TaxID=2828780 RepID=A0A9E4ZGM3_9EURY|nr:MULTISPECIES: 50S ribosomal protein L18e [Methanococcoides]MCM1987337.1 50S ribosomal protein L18e [Methanococcoides seepicolus]NOQ48266.1 50S ribosomal protein L18e [Methanococcoides sp.]